MSQEPLPSPPDNLPNSSPRIWLLTDGLSPTAVGLARRLLEIGDAVVCGVQPKEFSTSRADRLKALLRECETHDDDEIEDDSDEAESPRRERLKIVNIHIRYTAQIQAGIADAVNAFGRVDVLLLCHSEALIGTIEEISATPRTRSVISNQFETNFFSAITIIKSLLPLMRENKNGHIIALTGITAHLGTPGLAAYCASQWALEGYCDSLAYETAPFNIKVTIVQPNIEVGVLSNRITSVPSLTAYQPVNNKAPLARGLFSRLLDVIGSGDGESTTLGDELHSQTISSMYPDLPSTMVDKLVSETVHSLMSIGGHENPPARLIVGFEGIASVKDKLKTISEELEDFVDSSLQADIPREGMSEEQANAVAQAQAQTKEDDEKDTND